MWFDGPYYLFKGPWQMPKHGRMAKRKKVDRHGPERRSYEERMGITAFAASWSRWIKSPAGKRWVKIKERLAYLDRVDGQIAAPPIASESRT